MQINITVRNQSIIDICPCVVLAEDSQNYVTAAFTFLTDDWENTEKTAQFQNPKTGEVYESILDSSNACTVRWEALADSGDMNVAVFGVNGGYRITTNMGVITVLPTLSGGESDTPPSPDVYQQLLTMLGQKADNMTYSDSVLKLLSGSKELARVIIAGGGSGLQPDWNQNDSEAADYIKNRPFYDDTNVLLEWDGNTEGLVEAVTVDEVEGFPAGTAVAYKIAEYMDPESFIGTTVITSDGVEIKITEGDIWQDNGVYSIGGMIYMTNAQATAHSLNFPDPGTYIFLYDGIYASEIIAGGITKLPDKYLDYDSGELSKIPLIVIITFFQGVSFSETYEAITQALNDDRPVIGIAHYNNGYKLALPYWDTTARRVYFYSVNGFMSWKRVYIGISEKGYDNTIYISDIPELTPDGQETNAGRVITVSDSGQTYELKKLTATDVGALSGMTVLYWGDNHDADEHDSDVYGALGDTSCSSCVYAPNGPDSTGYPEGLIAPAWIFISSVERGARAFTVYDSGGQVWHGSFNLSSTIMAMHKISEDNGVFIVNFSPGDDDTITADKTVDEINQAIENGKLVLGTMNGTLAQLHQSDTDTAIFYGQYGLSMGTLTLSSDGTVTLDNPDIDADNLFIVSISLLQSTTFSASYEEITSAIRAGKVVIGVVNDGTSESIKLASSYWDTREERVYFYSIDGFDGWKSVYVGASSRGYDATRYQSDVPTLTVDDLETNAGCVIIVNSTGGSYQLKKLTAEDVNALGKDNTTEYTPTGDYNPATKKYVDDAVGNLIDRQMLLEKSIENYYAMRRTGKIYQTKIWKFATNPTSSGVKQLDNEGLVFEPSTDTEEGQDDYLNGQHPLFEWVHCNYVRDDDGTARPTAIEGMDNYKDTGAVDVGSMQMSFWWKWDDSNAEYDLITISDLPHPELGLIPWPECVKLDGTVVPWCIGSAYISGEASDGKLRSQPGLKPARNQSHNNMITNYQEKGDGYWGAGAVRNTFQFVFNAIKGNTKNSQTLYRGCTNYNLQYEASVQSTESHTYFPVTNAQAENIVVGSYVSIGYAGNNSGTENRDRGQASVHAYADDVKILSIETLDESNMAVYLDIPDESAFNTQPHVYTEGFSAPIILSTMHWWSGSTDSVKGRHDGSLGSNTDGKHPYRVQGREYAVGAYIAASDTAIDLQADYTKHVLVAPKGVPHSSSDTTIRSTYTEIGIIPAATAGNNADWWIGDIDLDMTTGSWYPSTEGSGSSQGTGDRVYAGGSGSTSGLREYLQGGYLWYGANAGSACLGCWSGLGGGTWFCAACD